MMDLFSEYKQAQQKVNQLKQLIDRCNHQFVEDPIQTVSVDVHHGESIGMSKHYALQQRRQCSGCGLIEHRMRYRPNDQWGAWGIGQTGTPIS